MTSQSTKTILLLLWFTAEAAGFNPAAIDVKKIKLNINESGQDLILSWSNPEPSVVKQCYDTHIKFKSSCHANWTETYKNSTKYYNLSVTKTRGSYHFKVRMRYSCRGASWSAWTREAKRDEIVPCHVLQSTVSPFLQDSTAYYHILWTLIVVIIILLFSLLTQKWFKNNILQNIPDPKHVQQSMLNFNYPAWWGAQPFPKVDCEAIEVEEVTNKINPEGRKDDEKGELQTEEEDEKKKEEEEEEKKQPDKEVEREETVQLLTAVDCGNGKEADGGSPMPTTAHAGICYGGGYIHWPKQT